MFDCPNEAVQTSFFAEPEDVGLTVSAETAATHLDLSVTRFNDLVRKNIIPKHGRGKYKLDAVRTAYIRHLRDVAGGKKGSTDNLELTAERARLAKAQADKVEMEVQSMESTLIAAEVIEKVWTTMVTRFRARLLSLPNKLAPQLAVSTDLNLTETTLRDSIYEALHELKTFHRSDYTDSTDSRTSHAAAQSTTTSERE